MRIHIVWHRRDLRLRDNALYSCVLATGTGDFGGEAPDDAFLVPLYIPDVSFPSPSTANGNANCPATFLVEHTGPFAAKFLVESVAELRASLRSIGSELFIRTGEKGADAAAVLKEFVRELKAAAAAAAAATHPAAPPPAVTITAAWHSIPGVYEAATEASVKAALQAVGVMCCNPCWSSTLWDPSELPYGQEGWGTVPAAVRRKAKKGKARGKGGAWKPEAADECTASKASLARGGQELPSARPPPPLTLQHQPAAALDEGNVGLPRVTASERWVGLPKTMNQFRRSATKAAAIRPPIERPTPHTLSPPPPSIPCGSLSDLTALLKEPPSTSLFGLTVDEVAKVYETAWRTEGKRRPKFNSLFRFLL